MRYSDLGVGLPPVSVISLGSWNTFSRLEVGELATLLREALHAGVNFFDVAYYWDKPDTEQVFGRAMRAAGARRAEYVLAQKLWLWDYPKRSFARQLEDSLGRLGAEYADLVMVSRPLPEMDFERFCDEITGLIDSGLCRAWGVTNWSAPQIRAAQGLIADPPRRPRLVQLQYNVCRRSTVESGEFARLFAETEIRLFPAFVLEGGILTGHIDRDRVQPSEFARGKVPRERNIARDAGRIRDLVRQRHAELVRIAAELRITPAQAAIAFCLSHPATASALVGVTRLADLRENLQSLSVEADAHTLRRALEPLSIAGAQAPKLFNPYNDE